MISSPLEKILLVEDNDGDARLLHEMLNEHANRTVLARVATMGEAEAYLANHRVDIILVDLGLPDSNGLEALGRAHAAAPGTATVVLTGTDDEDVAQLALQQGAQDYLIKGQIEARGLMRALRYAYEREADAQRARDEFAGIVRLKDDFVSTVSHELRTPLTSIAGALGLLESGVAGELPEKAANLVAIAHKNAKRLKRIVDDLLDFERLDSGKVEFDCNLVDLRKIASDAVEQNQPFAAYASARLIQDLPDFSVFVSVDEHRLLQAITNLVSNAVKFSPPGGAVTVQLASLGEVVRIRVSDQGPGVAEDFKDRLFERFTQAHDISTVTNLPGTGLGLAITRRIVEKMGGKIELVQDFRDGAAFDIIFPLEVRGCIKKAA